MEALSAAVARREIEFLDPEMHIWRGAVHRQHAEDGQAFGRGRIGAELAARTGSSEGVLGLGTALRAIKKACAKTTMICVARAGWRSQHCAEMRPQRSSDRAVRHTASNRTRAPAAKDFALCSTSFTREDWWRIGLRASML